MKTIVIGHKNPDTDTTVSAIAMAHYLNQTHDGEFEAQLTGSVNSETEFVLDFCKVQTPKICEDASDQKLFLVDHNEESQWVNGAQVENIIGFIDHHKIKFENSMPVEIITKPWGCTASIIYDLCKKDNVELSKELKSLMLCAMLSDTVILKSPTTTNIDKEFVEELTNELDIDYKELGMNMFKAKAQVASKTPQEIIKNDYKDFDMSGKKVGIGQIETPDLSELEPKLAEIKEQMQSMKEQEGYHSILLMLTDIIEEGTKLLVVSDDMDTIAQAFDTSFENNLSDFIAGMMSRKKQVAPVLVEKL